MPHAIPPGPYCPPDIPGTWEVGAPVIIVSEHESVQREHLSGRDNSPAIRIAKVCEEQGIPIGVPVPLLVWYLTHTAACTDLNPAERSRCWELARLVLAEASDRMRAADDWEEYAPLAQP